MAHPTDSAHDTEQDWILSERPDHPEEACGVFAVYAPGEEVGRMTYFGLHALQHRGQESAGIAVGDGHTLTVSKNLGLVPQAFKEADLATLEGHLAIGHTRYSTTGSSTSWENAQPMLSAILPSSGCNWVARSSMARARSRCRPRSAQV